MGSIEVRNPLLSKKLKRTETRLLIIDDNQIRFNKICDLLTTSEHQVHAFLLDDLQTFEKQLHLNWDIVIFGRAYDLKYEQALSLIRLSKQPELPLILLKPDDYEPNQYVTYIRKGVYDVANLDFPDRFYLSLLRALSFSRLNQGQQHLMQELENVQTQAQAWVSESNKAVAIIQEGIHIEANEEYLHLFGLKSEDEIIGLPLLDVLQPQDLNDFKLRFKKISQGQLDQGRFELTTLNSHVQTNPLKIEFLAAVEDDALQITIELNQTEHTTSAQPTVAQVEAPAAQPNTYQLINRTIAKQPADFNALVLFSLASCPESIFQQDWATSNAYFSNIHSFLKEQTNVPLFKVNHALYAGLFQGSSESVLESKLIGLSALSKPQLLGVNQQTFPLNLRMGYTLIQHNIKDEQQFQQLIERAYNTALPSGQEQNNIELNPIAPPNIELIDSHLNLQEHSSLLKALQKSLERGEIHLKYQQLYDKQDSNLYTYEVTSGFIYNNAWQDITSIRELADDPEFSIKLDRWILVEACKQLHNFITQYPDAKIIVNLNKEVLFSDRTFPAFIAKLITIVGSKQSHPLILQFSEEDIAKNLNDAQKYTAQLIQSGAEISLREFGNSIYSESILNQMSINHVTLHHQLAQMLDSDKSTEELQERINHFHEIKATQMLLRELNNMTMFANAWNVEARYLQGDYFQKKLDHLIDVQDQ